MEESKKKDYEEVFSDKNLMLLRMNMRSLLDVVRYLPHEIERARLMMGKNCSTCEYHKYILDDIDKTLKHYETSGYLLLEMGQIESFLYKVEDLLGM